MTVRLIVDSAAEAEINEAADYYDLESAGLGDAFLDEIDASFDAIRQFPTAAPCVLARIRKRPLIKFPYSLLYSVLDHEIRVLAVAHHRRRPFYWKGRRHA